MLAKACSFRDPSFLYPLQSHPDYWFHVGKSETMQVLVGLLGERMHAVAFNSSGDLMDVLDWPLAVPRAAAGRVMNIEELQNVVEREVTRYRQSADFSDEAIYVKRFRLPALQVGIDDLPEDLQEFALSPQSFDSSERSDLEEALKGWKDEALFVFWWGQSFYVDAEGTVSSS